MEIEEVIIITNINIVKRIDNPFTSAINLRVTTQKHHCEQILNMRNFECTE